MAQQTTIRKLTNAIEISGNISARMADTINQLPSRKKKLPGGSIAVELTIESARILHKRHLGSNMVVFDPEFLKYVAAIPKGGKDFIDVDYVPVLSNMEHQQDAFDRFKMEEFFGLFMEMGTGKTKALLDIAFYKYLTNQIDCLLIFAPNDVHSNWIHIEIPKHAPKDLPYKLFEWRSGSSPDKITARKIALQRNPDFLRVAAVNIEALVSDKARDFCLSYVRSGRCMTVIDESITIKNREAERTKAVFKLRDLSEYRAILSGQPISQGVQDLYSQLAWLSPEITGMPDYKSFQAKYLVMGGWENRKVVDYRNIEDLQQKIDKHCLRVTDAVLNLPTPLVFERNVYMTQQQTDIFMNLKENFILDLGNGVITDVNMAMTRVMKMQQVVWGYTRDEEGKVVELENNRVKYQVDMVEETGYKSIIACAYVPEMYMLQREFEKRKIPVLIANGSVKDKFAVVQAYEQTNDYKAIIANQAICRGHTMVSTRLFSYYSLLTNLEIYDQFWRRAQRKGQMQTLNVCHLITPKTPDVKNMNNLMRKKSTATTVLDVRELVESEEEFVSRPDDGYQYGEQTYERYY
jgi:hypothetical protein